jgi:hypothetical protein
METTTDTMNEKKDLKNVKVIMGFVITMTLLFISAWLAFKGSFLSTTCSVIAVMAFQSTLIQNYR